MPAKSLCRLCGSATELAFVARDRNREVDEARFVYRRCTVCSVTHLEEVPEDIGRYYSGDYHGMPDAAELGQRAAREAHKIDLLCAHVEPGRLVEVGPSYGAFAFAARRRGFSVTGIEMDAECCAFLEREVGVEAIHSAAPEDILRQLPPSRVIAMWHVLEHVPRPWDVVDAAAANLEPGGVLAIAVPNPESLQFRLLGARWAHLDAPRHQCLIPYPLLVDHARALGLKVAATTLTDPFGLHCNRWGWEYAMRRRPAARPSGLPVVLASHVVEKSLAALERTGRRGCAYTVLFRRPL